jgi:hypothetical protein
MITPAPKPEAFDKLLDAYVEELISMSDEAALDGADPATMQREGLALLEKARSVTGARRLAAARAKLAQHKDQAVAAATASPVSAQEARRFLAQVANDGRYTLAARELKDMSDEEALRLYQQFKRLEGQQVPPSDET